MRVLMGPVVQLRKLPSKIFPDRSVIYRALTIHDTQALIRRHGRMLAVQTAAGWKLRDRKGNLTPAGPGLARMYDALEAWRR